MYHKKLQIFSFFKLTALFFTSLRLRTCRKPLLTVSGAVCCLLAAIGLSLYLYPVEVKKIEVGTFAGFREGKLNGTAIDSEGRLFMGQVIKKINGPAAEYYLSLDIGPDGTIYVGTGHQASVYRVNPNPIPNSPAAPGSAGSAGSPAEEIFESDFLDVYALCAANNGDIYVGTAPGGRLYKIKSGKKYSVKNGSDIYEIKDKEKEPTPVKKEEYKSIEIYNPDERFIWDIKQDKQGNILFAVGSSGGVYKLDSSGIAKKIFTPEDAHIMSLYVSRDNSILAGSGDRGILYKIDNLKVKVLADSPLDEIKGICEDESGNIFFSASKGIDDRERNKNESIGIETFARQKKKDRPKPPPETSILYCLRTDGVVERIWDSEEEYIYSLVYDKKSDTVLFATGNAGRVYRVNKDGDFSIVYESESAQVFKLAARNGGFLAAANNTAGIAQIEENMNNQGQYLSEIFDLGIQSRLGRLYWNIGTNAGSDAAAGTGTGSSGSVMFAVRTGNSNFPDSTWSDWSAPFTDSANSTINVSGIRYFQVKVVMNSGSTSRTPYLDHFCIYYVQANLAPKVGKIRIIKPDPKKNPAVSVVYPGSSPESEHTVIKKTANGKHLIITWDAHDPNNDKLNYTLYLRKAGEQSWILFKENVTGKKVELDRELYEDGKYFLKIAADDYQANPPDSARSDTRVSAPFIIDSTAPVLQNLTVKGEQIDFNVTDSTSLITQVSVSMDGETWYPVFPLDKINDSRAESYSFNLAAAGYMQSSRGGIKSKKMIFIKVIDEFDNYKVFQREI